MWWWLGAGLAGQDDLQAGEQRGGARVGAAEAGVAQDQHPPFGLLHRDQMGGLEHARAQNRRSAGTSRLDNRGLNGDRE